MNAFSELYDFPHLPAKSLELIFICCACLCGTVCQGCHCYIEVYLFPSFILVVFTIVRQIILFITPYTCVLLFSFLRSFFLVMFSLL